MNAASKGYYSLIQYCPDLGRLEAANIGVLLFSPDRQFLKAQTARDNSRIIRFFGADSHDWTRINAFKKGLEDRIDSEGPQIRRLEDLQRFIELRANLLQITPPRPMKVTDPADDLRQLFEELIGDPGHRRPVRSLRKRIAAQLSAAHLERKVRTDVRVKVPILQKELEIPFAFHNGRCNLISPAGFESANPERSACTYAVEGRSLYENADPKLGELKLIVVGKFRAHDEESPEKVRRIFEAYHVTLFQAAQLGELIEEIRTTGKDINSA